MFELKFYIRGPQRVCYYFRSLHIASPTRIAFTKQNSNRKHFCKFVPRLELYIGKLRAKVQTMKT